MGKCRDCKFFAGWENDGELAVCNATDEIEYIDRAYAELTELYCDFYVEKLDDNETKESSA